MISACIALHSFFFNTGLGFLHLLPKVEDKLDQLDANAAKGDNNLITYHDAVKEQLN